MVSSIIDIGAKTDIRVISQVERSVQTGEEIHVYKSQVYEVLDNGEIELLMPSEGGRLILLPLGIRYEFVFYTKSGLYKANGQIKERYKADNRYMIRIELNTQLSKFQRRQFYRLECVIDMTYFNITKEQSDLPTVEAVLESLRDSEFFHKQKKACIVDISGGGVRFISSEKNSPDSYMLMIVMLNNGIAEKQYLIIGHIISCEKVEHSDIRDIKYENRVEFLLKDRRMQEDIIKFIFAEERRSRKNDK